MKLSQLGWSSSYARAFEFWRLRGCVPGRVAAAQRGVYHVLTETGETDAPAAARAGAVLVGDWAALRPGGAIEAVLPRRTVLERKRPGPGVAPQPMAANVDLLLIVTGLDGDFSPRRIERYLVVAAHSGIEPVLVLSKADLVAEPERRKAVETVRALSPGSPVVLWSAFDPSGIELLDAAIAPGQTAALAGSSGVGKSTMVNRVAGRDLLATAPVRENDSRGRHTTTRRELIPLPQGWVLIDMPGMREVQLWADEETVDEAFDDIAALAPQCRFRDCTHGPEPGCAVRAAAEEGRLDASRLSQYEQLRREAAWVEAQQDLSARLARKRREKALSRAVARLSPE